MTIFLNDHFVNMAEDIAIECFKNGADVLLNLYTDRYYLGYMTYLSFESLRQPSVWCRELTRNATAQFWLGGTYDPAVYRKVSADRMAANNEGENNAHFPLAKERKVRSLGVGLGMVTKPRGKAYGFNFNTWLRMTETASRVDPEMLAKKGRELAARLQAADKIRITSKNGTGLQLSAKERTPMINDGVVDDQDIMQDNLNASIPAGSVDVAVLEDSANGKVVLDVPTPWAGRTIRRIIWTFSGGKLTSFEGDKVAELLRKEWEASSGDKDRIATVSVGLNPKAKPGFLINNIVEGAIGIGIGGNEDLGGKNKPGFFHAATLKMGTLEADGTVVVEQGNLRI